MKRVRVRVKKRMKDRRIRSGGKDEKIGGMREKEEEIKMRKMNWEEGRKIEETEERERIGE